MNVSEKKRVRLGEYIELCDEKNNKGLYTVNDVRGMTITKEIIPTKADLNGTELSNFLVVKPKEFVYNPRTHGKKIGLGFNNTQKAFIISWNNIAFRVKDEGKLLPDYLYIIICREEWDRSACFRSWGSSTEVFSWSEFCLMEIPLPSPEVQQELVDTYNGLKTLAEQNEALIEPLSKACEAFVVDCKTKYPEVELSNGQDDYIELCDERNSEGKYTLDDVRGISIQKKLISTKADMKDVSLTPYKLLKPFEFSYVTVTSRNGEKISLAMNDTNSTYIVSSSYVNFRCKDYNKLMPEYLYLLLSRSEFDRYARFNSWGSARETFDWSELCRVKISLPGIEVQRSIVNLYKCLEEAKKIASEAREKLKMLCPALVQKAANS
ncbi:conserved domain protein [Bacteroides sp. CAG:598]|nr:conserved domain protein [Bacteroides sp. CAG:598]